MRYAALPLPVSVLAALAIGAGEAPPPAQPEAKKEEASAEHVLRQRFLVAYESAQTPARKAEVVEMLRGVKEKESQRLITGMLGNSSEVVRRSACMVMAATPDPEGFFVKPLMGVLADPALSVRLAAAEALGAAAVRADAIKALAFALMETVGSAKPENAVDEAKLITAYDRALQKLTGERSPEREARAIGNFWMDYWKKNGEEIAAKERRAREAEPPPRPPNLPKDSLDK